MQLGLIEALLAQGRTTEAHQHGEQALARAELTTDARVQLEAEAAWARLFAGDLAGAVGVARQALTRADQLGADPAACIALNVLCVVALFQGRTGEAERLARANISRAEASPSREVMRYSPHIFLAAALIDADCLDEAEQALQRGRRHAEALGTGCCGPVPGSRRPGASPTWPWAP